MATNKRDLFKEIELNRGGLPYANTQVLIGPGRATTQGNNPAPPASAYSP